MSTYSSGAAAKRRKGGRSPTLGLLQRINAFVEPRVRSGLASPGLLPAGLIILETKGRKTGKPHTTPLMASRWPGGHLWVTTVLGRRSDWLRNAKADPSVRYWLGGRVREGHAITAVPGHPAPDLSELPKALRWPARKWFDATLFAGFGALIIAPSRDDD